ncbi:MAG: hypothetical protein IIB54_06280 [Planctomycetes bacterium]|nr:hypothetical protein [Planctomycetota bacterium]
MNNPDESRDLFSTAGQEIERVYLLDRLPELPAGAEVWRIEQGYLPELLPGDQGSVDPLEGRLRRVIMPDETVVFTHTIKRGKGLVREELERSMTETEFARHWPRTESRRLSKTRHRITVGELIWEIDDFDQLDIVLAEVELTDVDMKVEIPDWLASHIVREVTDEPEYRNYELALRAMKELGEGGHAGSGGF